MTMFELDPRLAADTEELGSIGLCRVLLMCDARYPWLILVPEKPDLIEIGDLDRTGRTRLMDETDLAAGALSRLYTPEKINIGALGNIVRQLHVHVVARYDGDPAWPGPVWGHSAALPYSPVELAARASEIRAALDIPPATALA